MMRMMKVISLWMKKKELLWKPSHQLMKMKVVLLKMNMSLISLMMVKKNLKVKTTENRVQK